MVLQFYFKSDVRFSAECFSAVAKPNKTAKMKKWQLCAALATSSLANLISAHQEGVVLEIGGEKNQVHEGHLHHPNKVRKI